MITLLLSDSNVHESNVLETAFCQNNFVVIRFNPSFQFYVKILQYSPNVILMEMPSLCKDHLHFIELIRKQKRFANVPVIGFGDVVDLMIFNFYKKTGLNSYLARPLKFASIIEKIELYLHKKVIAEIISKEQISDSITFLFDKDILPLKKIEFMSDSVSKLLAFPFTATKVMSLSNNDNTGAKQLAQVIIADPTISAQILRMANSVFFASLNRRISSIHDAIVRIGFRETKRIVVSMAVMNLFDKEIHNAGFNRTAFWYHSISCAIAAEHIARRGCNVNGDEAFMAGLFHDLGILMMDEYFPDVLSAILSSTTDNASEFLIEEIKSMSISHVDFTLALFEKWKIPVNITRGIGKKHEFRKLVDDKSEESLVAIVTGLAELLVKSLMVGLECDEFVRPVDNEFFTIVKMPAGFNESFVNEIFKDISFYQKFLKIDESDICISTGDVENFDSIKIAVLNTDKDLFVPPLLYLRQKRVVVQEFNSVETSQLNGLFDILLVWYSKKQQPEDIDNLKNIKRRVNSKLVKITDDYLPVLVIINDSSERDLFKNNNFSLLPKEVDMRYIDIALSEIIDGSSYNYYKKQSTKDNKDCNEIVDNETVKTERE